MMTNDDFQIVRDTAAGSVQGRIVRGAVLAAVAAWADSRFRRLVIDGFSSAFGGADPATWVRHGAIAVVVAAAINLTLLSMAPVYAAPGIPRAVIAGLAIIAGVVAIAPDQFTIAWPQSLAGRWWRALGRLQNNAE